MLRMTIERMRTSRSHLCMVGRVGRMPRVATRQTQPVHKLLSVFGDQIFLRFDRLVLRESVPDNHDHKAPVKPFANVSLPDLVAAVLRPRSSYGPFSDVEDEAGGIFVQINVARQQV